ncbi:MAG: DEAD/DEAH box helicase [Kineosporiaceae bacterium]
MSDPPRHRSTARPRAATARRIVRRPAPSTALPTRKIHVPTTSRTTRRTRPAVPAQGAATTPDPTRAPRAAQPAAAAPRTFADLGVPQPLVAALAAEGITEPFAIQAATVASGLAGRDVLGRARTGAGKTLAFSLPLVARLSRPGAPRAAARRPRALVLAPTRELATQIAAVLAPLTKAVGLTQATVFGGVGQGPQVAKLAAGVDVVVACPGRLEDLVGQRHVDLSAVEITVLDEADHMADLGFLPGVKRLLDRTPATAQRLLFSATLDAAVDVLVKRYLRDPERISIDAAAAAPVTMDHHVLDVAQADKQAVVRELAAGQARTLLFTRTKHQARRLARVLTAAGTPAVDLHGDLTQGARERNLAAFSEGRATVLVATDIAARGIHVDDVALVVHVDPPADHKAYLHRSGRTARAGSAGLVVTVATHDQRSDVTALAKAAAIAPTRTSVTPGHPLLLDLTGPRAAYVAPPEPAVKTQAAPARAKLGGRAKQGRPTQGLAGQGQAATATTGGGRSRSRGRAKAAAPAHAPAAPSGQRAAGGSSSTHAGAGSHSAATFSSRGSGGRRRRG